MRETLGGAAGGGSRNATVANGVRVSLFHRKHAVDEPVPDRTWDVTDKQGVTRRYATADFDEFFTTTDAHVVHQHVSIGWLLLDESVLPGAGPGHEELVTRPVSAGGYGGQSLRKVPVRVPDDLPRFLLGHLRPGAEGALVEP